jgi:hypothetical protein
MSEEKIIHQFKKNANETVTVKFTQFKGKRLIDIRAYYAAENGDLKPTPKGISISRDLISELKEAIDKAAEEWERELPGGLGEIMNPSGRMVKLPGNPSLTMRRAPILGKRGC